MVKTIEQAETLRNKTFEYLTPILRTFSDRIVLKLNDLSVMAFGIEDAYDRDVKFPCFYILIDMRYKTEESYKILEYFKKQDYFVKTYNHDFDKIMLVIKIPEDYHKAFYKFKKSKYSEMYNEEDIQKFFNTKSRRSTYEKLLKSDKGAEIYSEAVSKEFSIDIRSLDIQHHDQYDVPLDLDIGKEIFNYKKSKNKTR